VRIFLILLICLAPPVFAAEYHIGTGQTYTTIGGFAWTTLDAGDIVYIHPGTYHEFLYVSSALKGTESNPIRIVGVSDVEGNQPVLDASNATIGTNFDAYGSPIYHELLGVLTFGTRATGYAYPGDAPTWVSVENIKIQNYKNVTVTDSDSVVHNNYYGQCVYLQAGQNITLDNITVTGCEDGIFGKDNGPPVQDITVKNSYIYDNGITTAEVTANPDLISAYLYHNVYTEVDGIIFENNIFGRPITGSPGNNVKDRSSGFIFRYNKLEGGAHLLDLVECQDNCANHTTDEKWDDSFVYGNTFYSTHGDASQLFHLGTGDTGANTSYWRQNLYFYNNTVAINHDQATTYKINIFQITSNGQTVYLNNNIFYTYPVTNGAAIPVIGIQQDNSVTTTAAGNFTYGVNWITAGWQESRDGTTVTGTTIGLSNITSTGAISMVDAPNKDFRLSETSVGINLGDDLPSVVTASNWSGGDLTPLYQPIGVARESVDDVGAFEFPGHTKTGISSSGTIFSSGGSGTPISILE